MEKPSPKPAKSLVIIAVLIALLSLAWWSRYEVVAASNGERHGAIYLVNRWTGSIKWVHIDEVIEVNQRASTP